MLQTINFSNEFDFKAIQEYIERIPQIKRLNGQSVKMTVFKEFATDIHGKEPIAIRFVLEQNHDRKYIVKQNYTRHDKLSLYHKRFFDQLLTEIQFVIWMSN